MKELPFELKRMLDALGAKENVPMAQYTSFKTGGSVRILAEPDTAEHTAELMRLIEAAGVEHYVIGNGTNDFPAFYCRKSGYGVDYAAKDEADIAKLIHTKQELGLKGGMLIGNPIPEEYAMDFDYMEEVIQRALVKADEAGVHGKNITPFLLASIKDITGGKAFEANVKLALNNARCAAKIAKALSDME